MKIHNVPRPRVWMKKFTKLKHSDVTFDSTFYDDIAKVVGQKDFVVKDCLTWSLHHQFDDPATIQMFHRRGNLSVPPMKIRFFSVDQSNDYYLQVWKNSISSSRTLQNPELVRVAYTSMRISPGTTIHGGGFKNLNLIGNYRIQLHIYDEYPHYDITKNIYYKHYTFSNVTNKQLDLYRFEEVKRNALSQNNNIDNISSSYTQVRIKNMIPNHHRQQI